MCDCLCALAPATADGHTLFAKNSDRPPGEAQLVEWFAPRRDEPSTHTTYLAIPPAAARTVGFIGSRPEWAWGVEHGVNEAGVAIGNETIFTTLDPRGAPAGLIGIDLVRLGLERATSAAEATEVLIALLEAHGQGGSGHGDRDVPYWSSFLVADPARAFVLETSGTTWAVERIERTRAISNRTTIPSFDAEHRHPRQPVDRLVDPRWRASQAVLAAEPVAAGALAAHLRRHVGEDGWTVCMHVPDVEATTAAMIAELPGSGPPRAQFLLGWPCRSVFVPLTVGYGWTGATPAWERFAALDDGHRDSLDALEAELAAAARDDPDWNTEAWRLVSEALDRLTPVTDR